MASFEELVEEFQAATGPAHGMIARPNGTFFSYVLVQEALHALRLELAASAELTSAGRRFVASAAAYLAALAKHSLEQRGMSVEIVCHGNPEEDQAALLLCVAMNGRADSSPYRQNILNDMHAVVLSPPPEFQALPDYRCSLQGGAAVSIEYPYLLGVCLCQSPLADGEQRMDRSVDEEFAFREQLASDLLVDIGLHGEEEMFGEIAHAAVWPPYGWQQNAGQFLNMSMLIDRIGAQHSVAIADGIRFLRAMLFSQAAYLRFLAARTLLVLGEGPTTVEESQLFGQAIHADDFADAEEAMLLLRWRIEQDAAGEAAPIDELPEGAVEVYRNSWQELLRAGPRQEYFALPIFSDPEYIEFGSLDVSENDRRRALAEQLQERHPGDWFAQVALADTLLRGEQPEEGEQLLIDACRAAPGPVAHFTLAAYYCRAGRFQDAQGVFVELVKRWPWNHHGVANAMWSITRGMTGRKTD